MRKSYPSLKRQHGVATLLFILLAAVGLMAASASALLAASGAQKLQYAEHVSTQSDMSAWTGVSVLSSAVAALPLSANLTPNSPVTFQGTQSGISATYVGKQREFLFFQVTGSSGGAKTVLSAAFSAPQGSTPPSSSDGTLMAGQTLWGTTTITGSVSYAGAAPRSLSVINGDLAMSGSVSGLDTVCATGDITITSAIQVKTVCSNKSVTLKGAAAVTTLNAGGNVILSGGATAALGTINSNGAVTLSGGSASAGVVNATGDVIISGGSARGGAVNTEGLINWTSSLTADTLNANGPVTYSTSASTAATDINARGDVSLSAARNVNTAGKTTLTGYSGQGISGTLQGQGLLSGSSWGANGSAVVAAGAVGSITTPVPPKVHVSVTPGLTVPIAAVTIPVLPIFAATHLTIDAYALKAQANFAFTGVDSAGNPIVIVNSINGIPNGTYLVANKGGVGGNFLCATATGSTCINPLLKICQGFSNQNACFSYNSGAWKIQGTAMLPGVTWFLGDLTVGSGTWVNSFIATGNITTSGSVKLYAPNYPSSGYTCQGLADPAQNLPSLATNGLDAGSFSTRLCSGTPPVLNGTAIGNVALVAGGYSDSTFAGGDVNLVASVSIFGSVLVGQFLNTRGSTTVAGSIYAAAQGGTTIGQNSMGGSTTILDPTGSTAYVSTRVPCMAGCGVAPPPIANNIVWVSPI